MKLSFVILLIFVSLFSIISGTKSSCKKRSDVCWVADDCCGVKGTRMVCAEHLEICGKTKRCCITEIEEQQEKQAAIIRNRVGKRFWNLLFDEDDQ